MVPRRLPQRAGARSTRRGSSTGDAGTVAATVCRVLGGGGSPLAGRAPVGGPFAGAVALVGDLNRSAAPQTGAGRASVDEQVLFAPPRGVAGRAVAVRLQQPLGEGGEAGGVLGREVADGQPRGHPEQEAELALVDI